jgi:hypothetical protein
MPFLTGVILRWSKGRKTTRPEMMTMMMMMMININTALGK